MQSDTVEQFVLFAYCSPSKRVLSYLKVTGNSLAKTLIDPICISLYFREFPANNRLQSSVGRDSLNQYGL